MQGLFQKNPDIADGRRTRSAPRGLFPSRFRLSPPVPPRGKSSENRSAWSAGSFRRADLRPDRGKPAGNTAVFPRAPAPHGQGSAVGNHRGSPPAGYIRGFMRKRLWTLPRAYDIIIVAANRGGQTSSAHLTNSREAVGQGVALPTANAVLRSSRLCRSKRERREVFSAASGSCKVGTSALCAEV